ncbi:MAG: T9SS type A sorting domain-containing protein [Lentimicrobium sp.]
MKNKLFFFAFFFEVMFSASITQAQMKYWITPSLKFNISTSIPSSTALPGPGGAYSVANGVYDDNGNILFYVRDYNIYGPTGQSIGILPGYNMSVCNEAYTILNSEINIVPIPGTCRQFYVIYSMDNPIGYSPVLYVKVNCSGTTPVVTYDGWVYASCPYYSGLFPIPYLVSNHGGWDNTGMAVSKVITGSGSTEKRFLFSVGNGEVVRSEITSSGICAGIPVVTADELQIDILNFEAFEAELSWGTNYFAWSSDNGKVHVINIFPLSGNYVSGSHQSYSIPGAKGIEFTLYETNPKLYVSGRNGLTQILTSNQSQSLISTGTFDLTNAQLEYAKNNRIYGISPTYDGQGNLIATTLVGINWGNNTFTSVNAGFDSRYLESGSYTYGVFTLPDQIDGENYAYFNGTPAVLISNFTINGSVPIGNCDEGGYGKYCQNSALSFNATYSAGTPVQYKFDIQAVDWGCNFITGAGLMNYQGAWTNDTPPANLDLRTLTSNGVNLGNCQGGLVMITYSVKDACGTINTRSKVVNMYVPVPPVVDLEIYNKDNPQIYHDPSQNINLPVLCGSASIGYRINNSTGTITFLTVLVEQVSPYKLIYNRTTTVNGVNNLTYENLNNYCINSTVWDQYSGFASCNTGSYTGWTGYFAYTNGLLSYNKTFKLTVTVGNQCGSSTNWSYLKVNSIGNKMATADNETGNNRAEELLVYPNPASDQITVQFNNLTEENYQIDVVDMTGRQVLLLLPETKIAKGIYEKSFDISILRSGIYSYRVKSATRIKTGLISKF